MVKQYEKDDIDKPFLSCGNRKIGKDTFILNMQASTDCKMRIDKTCNLWDKCYAMKAERLYPACLPFRRRQSRIWRKTDAITLARKIVSESQKKKYKGRIKYLRFSESGDFCSQRDVDKMSKLSDYLSKFGIKVYGYTMRQDMDFSKVSKNMVVTGSGFMIHNNFKIVTEYKRALRCPGKCLNCMLCKIRGKRIIENKLH